MMGTDLEPHNIVLLQYSESAIAPAHAYRINRTLLAHALEFQATVTRI